MRQLHGLSSLILFRGPGTGGGIFQESIYLCSFQRSPSTRVSRCSAWWSECAGDVRKEEVNNLPFDPNRKCVSLPGQMLKHWFQAVCFMWVTSSMWEVIKAPKDLMECPFTPLPASCDLPSSGSQRVSCYCQLVSYSWQLETYFSLLSPACFWNYFILLHCYKGSHLLESCGWNRLCHSFFFFF